MSHRKEVQESCEALQAEARARGWQCMFDEMGDKHRLWVWPDKLMDKGYCADFHHDGEADVHFVPAEPGQGAHWHMPNEDACYYLLERMESGRAA